MIVHKHAVSGEPVTINVVETEDDLDGFDAFMREYDGLLLGLDSETTGLDIYSEGFKIRLAQFGTDREAWVLPVELGGRYADAAVQAMTRHSGGLVLHNASYDLQVFDRTLGIPMESMWPKVTDTRILSHLVDPRGKDEGGLGHGLEELTRYHLDSEVADNVKTLMKDLASENKTTVGNVWKKVPLADPRYQLYSGMDPILAVRLHDKLRPLVPSASVDLVGYEHKLAAVCSYMERTGFLLDVEYTENLSDELKLRESRFTEIAHNNGCDMVNSTDQVADALETFGITIPGRTPSGKRKVDDALLTQVIEAGGPAAEFANAVIEGKKAGKWRKTWVETFLKGRDSGNRCHASINPLRARTARMSITGIPAQTLPAGDWMIRRCFLADQGEVMASVDYQSQELRVMAALSGDQTMIHAFLQGADLHAMTAAAAFHVPLDAVTKAQRLGGKTANFGKAYGGGPKAISEQTGVDFFTAKALSDAFDSTYPGVAALSMKLQAEATKTGSVITPTGRRLPVDQARAYSALNYVIQSTSRDVTGRALLRLHDAGFTPNMRLPIHDEVLLSVPAAKAEWGAAKIGEIMAEQMGPLLIGTDPEVGGRSWGSLYGSDF